MILNLIKEPILLPKINQKKESTMKTLLVTLTLLMTYMPMAFSTESGTITKTKSIKPNPAYQEDREGEDDPGILRDAQQGNAGAQFAYGMIQYGKGKYKVAADWYLKAANQNHQRAQYELGKMYVKGQGVPVNYQRAYFLYSLSAARGYNDSARAKASLVKSMTPAELREAQAMVRIWNSRKR